MEVDLRKRVVGGWWQGLKGLGDDYDYGGEYGTPPDAVIGIVGNTDYADPWADYYGGIDTSGITPGTPYIFDLPGGEPGYLQSYQDVLDYAAAHPGDFGTPSTAPTALQIANAITKFTQMGIRAVAPAASGTCPVGFVRSGAACVPATGPTPANPQWIPGVSNSTLLIAGVGAFFILLLAGGRKR